jgi:FAD/FMN-containing dehydrogenase
VKQKESWNKVPKVMSKNIEILKNTSSLSLNNKNTFLAHGLGRSYGDVCLNENGNLLVTTNLNKIIEIDSEGGVVKCESGVSINDLLRIIVPLGWFLPVVPGTRYVTIGGAIANDIHGKNHHNSGSFGNFVNQFELMRSNGEILVCNNKENSELFKATIGGLGLTGLITWAELKLKKINNSYLTSQTERFGDIDNYWELNETLEHKYEYTVAWIDCLFDKKQKVRGVFHSGNHSESSQLDKSDSSFSIPFPVTSPVSLVNKVSINLLNQLYFSVNKKSKDKAQAYKSFFFPLDVITSWNKVYGRKGFYQYQFVIPGKNSRSGVQEIIKAISLSKESPSLGVLKNFGGIPSIGMMSFPREGVTFAIDFPNRGTSTLKLLNILDAIVLEHDGSIYPAKDARMSSETFSRSFPNISTFSKYIDPNFSSSFWRRVS